MKQIVLGLLVAVLITSPAAGEEMPCYGITDGIHTADPPPLLTPNECEAAQSRDKKFRLRLTEIPRGDGDSISFSVTPKIPKDPTNLDEWGLTVWIKIPF